MLPERGTTATDGRRRSKGRTARTEREGRATEAILTPQRSRSPSQVPRTALPASFPTTAPPAPPGPSAIPVDFPNDYCYSKRNPK